VIDSAVFKVGLRRDEGVRYDLGDGSKFLIFTVTPKHKNEKATGVYSSL
jgi:hypothetical protein